MSLRTGVRSDRVFVAGVLAALVSTLLLTAPPAAAAVADAPSVTASFNGRVNAIAFSGTTIYVAGSFTSATDVTGQVFRRNRVAAVDALTGALLAWAPSADRRVHALAVHGSHVYLGGDFTKVNGTSRTRLARVDAVTGKLDPAFVHRVDGRVKAVSAAADRLYLAGMFATVDGQPRTKAAAIELTADTLDPAWQPALSGGAVLSLVPVGDRVYLAGRFTSLNGDPARAYVGAVNPLTGATDSSFPATLPYPAFDLEVTAEAVYVAADGQGGHLHALALDGSDRWVITTDGGVQAVAASGSEIYFGGHWDNICTTARNGAKGVCLDGSVGIRKLALANADGSLVDSWRPQPNSALGVFALAADSAGSVAAGGDFTTFGSGQITQHRFAKLDPPPAG